MDAKYFEEIKLREKAATLGPWELGNYNAINATFAKICNASTSIDADFIAHAKADIPALIAEVERLQAELAAKDKQIAVLKLAQEQEDEK